MPDVLIRLQEQGPDPENVVAGPWGALVLGLLVVATVLLCWSFVRQLRKAQSARDRGLYGDDVDPSGEGRTGDGGRAGADGPDATHRDA